MWRPLACSILTVLAAGALPAATVADVDVFTGTSNSRWMMFPGPCVPFGLVKFSPDNQGNVWNGGYEYTVQSISGFSHLHSFGLSGLSLMPVTGPMEYNQGLYRVYPGPPDGPFGAMWTAGYRSRFRRESEHGAPGSYAVELLDWSVRAEVTATAHCGVMRLTYPTTEEAHLLLDFAFPAEEHNDIQGVTIEPGAANEIHGTIREHNHYAGNFTVAFTLRASQPITSIDGWQRGAPPAGVSNYGADWRTPVVYRRGIHGFTGQGACGISLNFAADRTRPVVIATGVSLVDVAGARRNFEAELGPLHGDFEAVAAAARQAWSDILRVADVEGGTAGQRRLFATCLYRAFSAKAMLQDVDGRYRDFTGHTGQAPAGENIYSSDAFWGAQWTLFPLWTLLSPETANAWDRFLVSQARHWGWMPQAPVLGGYAPVMVAQHEQALVISSYQKGIRRFDVAAAYAVIRHDLTTPGTALPNGGGAGDRNLASYLRHGYVPDEDGPSSNTFEYAFDDWAAAQLAGALGHDDDRREFLRRSDSWRNGLDPATHYARRRHADGSWVAPEARWEFGTTGGWNGPGFVEGTPWIYSWFVPHDLPGLARLVGRGELNRRLEEGFARGWVDITNEENLQAPFIFNYTGEPWRTQQHVRESLVKYWDPSPLVGWVGEEDEGQLSALYVLWSLGLFEMDGGCGPNPGYDLSAPLFSRAVLHFDREYYGGHTLTIIARHQSPANCYIQTATFNGRPLLRPWISHAAIVAGGTLEYTLGPTPNRAWGAARSDP